MLKLDVLLGIIFVITTLFFFFSVLDSVLQMCAFALAIVWASMGHASVRLEKKTLMYIHLGLAVVMPIYVIWKTMDLYAEERDGSTEDVPYPQIYITAVAAVVVRILTFAGAIGCYYRFGKGMFFRSPGRAQG